MGAHACQRLPLLLITLSIAFADQDHEQRQISGAVPSIIRPEIQSLANTNTSKAIGIKAINAIAGT